MITFTIAAFVLGALLGLLFNVAALLFVLVALAGSIFVVTVQLQLDLTKALTSALSAELVLSMGYLGGIALRGLIRTRR
jgi:hypothetical protein